MNVGGVPGTDESRCQWERHIAEVWQEVLGVGPIEPDADFFALGGDSMKGLRSLLLIHPDLEWGDVFRNPTVGGLAAHIQAVLGDFETARMEVAEA